MAFMIPEKLNTTMPVAEQETFALLRRYFPKSATIWHRDALEIDDVPPFVILDDEVGSVLVTVFDWQPEQAINLRLWSKGNLLKPATLAALKGAEEKTKKFFQLLKNSRLPAIVDTEGNLSIAHHQVYILQQFKSKDITRFKLRNSFPHDSIVVAPDDIHHLHSILKQQTFNGQVLNGEAFNAIRLIISPSVEISGRRPVNNNNNHQAIVSGRFQEVTPLHSGAQFYQLPMMLDVQQEQLVKSYAHIPEKDKRLAKSLDVRLIRGVVGSGKSLILLHRANFLSGLHDKWNIVVLTYNRSLATYLNAKQMEISGEYSSVEIRNYHSWCNQMLRDAGLWRNTVLNDSSRNGVLARLGVKDKACLSSLSNPYILEEFDWIRDNGLSTEEQYLQIARRGRHRRISSEQRKAIWQLLLKYREFLHDKDMFDWPEVTMLMLEGLAQGKIDGQQYHAILVDEAQDFAPSWFQVVQQLLNPQTNMLFVVADAAQKIYKRALSWKALGIDVSGGRSRILNKSYRNTYEILKVAYELIADDSVLKEELQSQGEDIIQPDLDSKQMRRGAMPIILQFSDSASECNYIAEEIIRLHENGFEWHEIAIIHRNKQFLRNEMAKALWRYNIPMEILVNRNPDSERFSVKLVTMHSSKGLEFSAVFIAGIDRLKPSPGLNAEELKEQITKERQLLYVGMTRARERLYISHTGMLPAWTLSAMQMAERKMA